MYLRLFICILSLSLTHTHTHTHTHRIDKAIAKVYRIAICDFSNSRLISSCVAFIEMLSRDSANLRLDTQAAMRICNYLDSRLDLDGSQNMVGVKDVVIDPSEQKATIKNKIGKGI